MKMKQQDVKMQLKCTRREFNDCFKNSLFFHVQFYIQLNIKQVYELDVPF